MKKKVTIQDIADALGVSRNTVSKAINNSEGLADGTREKILQKAIEMGYKQFSYVSTLAKSAATVMDAPHFTGEIALFTTIFLNQSHFGTLMMDKFQREISQLGYTLNTHRVTAQNIADRTLPSTFVPERCSAIICIEMFDRAYDEMVCELDLPVLFVDGPAKLDGFSLPADQLYMENVTGITKFVNHMVDNGQTRIGFVGNYEHCESFYERYMAYRCAMLRRNIEVDDTFTIKCHAFDEMSERINGLGRLPDVFICANDFIALDLIHLLGARGVRVPNDVRICGFDDAAESRIIVPNLTTVHIHTQIMAFSALHLLVSRMREPSLDYRMVYTETELIYRDSSEIK